jgi:sugar phosphate isomerase/epimerase
VTIALENTPDEMGAPASLAQFVKETHLHDLRICFDAGHAHMDGALETGFEAVRDRVVTAHIHDNHGEKDEHLLPYEGSIDWDAALGAIAGAPEPVALVLELKNQAAGGPSLDQVRDVFDKIEKKLEAKRPRAVRP